MHSKVITYIILLTVSSILSQAQENNIVHKKTQELLDNKNILWIGEFETTYILNNAQASIQKGYLVDNKELIDNYFKYLKIKIPHVDSTNSSHIFLSSKIIANIEKIETFENSKLNTKNKGTQELLLKKIDTLKNYNTDISDNPFQLSKTYFSENDCTLFKLKQLIFYDSLSMMFKSLPLSLAPIFSTSAKNGSSEKNPFWLKIKNLNIAPDLDNPDISWAIRTYRNIDIRKGNILKEKYALDSIINIMLNDIVASSEAISLGMHYTLDGIDKMPSETIKKLVTSMDTIFKLNEQLEELIEIHHQTIIAKDLKRIRIIQDWIWDDAKKDIAIYSVGFAPIFKDLKYQNEERVLFVRKIDSDRFNRIDYNKQ